MHVYLIFGAFDYFTYTSVYHFSKQNLPLNLVLGLTAVVDDAEAVVVTGSLVVSSK